MINIKAIRDTEIVRDYFFSNFASLQLCQFCQWRLSKLNHTSILSSLIFLQSTLPFHDFENLLAS